MGTAVIILKQITVMFLYMFAGYILFRKESITIKGSRDIAAILVQLVIPAVIVNSFCVEYSHEKMLQLAQSAFISALGIGLSALIAWLIFRKHPVDNFGSAMSNAGFIGIPLIQAAFGNKAVFYIVAIVAIMNMMQWSYGVRMITGERSALSVRRLFINPIFISIGIGFVLFVTGAGAHLPDVLSSVLDGLSALNAPLSMLVMGSYLAQSDLKKMVSSPRLYLTCFVRLVLIPAVTLVVFSFMHFDSTLMMAVFIALATPAGANTAVYSQLYDADYPYACQVVTMTALLSIITLPLMIVAAEYMGI